MSQANVMRFALALIHRHGRDKARELAAMGKDRTWQRVRKALSLDTLELEAVRGCQ